MLRPKLPPNLSDDVAAQGPWPWIVFAGFLAVCNLGYGSLMELFNRGDSELLMFLLTGCVVAEAAILPAWLVWGSGPLWQRLVWHVCSALVLTLLWFAGMIPWLHGGDLTKDVPMFLISLPPVVVAVSAPLWLVKLFFGWRVVPCQESDEAGEKLSIRDYLIGMAVVGVALASARLAMAIGQPPQEWEYWLPLGVAVALAAAAGLLLELPVLWFAFRFRWPAPSVPAVGFTMLIAAVIVIAVVTARGGRLPGGRFVVGLCLFFLSLGYTTAVAFWLARASGYRLETGSQAAR